MKNINRNKRKNTCSIIVVPIILILIFISISVFSNVSAVKYYETRKIVVEENDTLWDIASSICKDNPNLSIYSVINDIKKINNMNSSLVYVGQILEIYIY